MTSHDVHLERLVDATPEQAFNAWVDPAARASWYAPGASWAPAVAESDLRAGGKWSVAFGPDDHRYVEDGVYTEVDPPHRLAYSCAFRGGDGSTFETQVTVTFTAQGDKTLLVLDDRGFPDESIRDRHANGWPGFLDSYERVLALGP